MTTLLKKSAQQYLQFDADMKEQLSTTVDKRKCTNCEVKGKPDARLMMCKGCMSDRIRYCVSLAPSLRMRFLRAKALL